MAAVESTSVISVLAAVNFFVLFGGGVWKVLSFGHRPESNSTRQLLVLSSLQNTGYVREAVFGRPGTADVSHLVGAVMSWRPHGSRARTGSWQ